MNLNLESEVRILNLLIQDFATVRRSCHSRSHSCGFPRCPRFPRFPRFPRCPRFPRFPRFVRCEPHVHAYMPMFLHMHRLMNMPMHMHMHMHMHIIINIKPDANLDANQMRTRCEDANQMRTRCEPDANRMRTSKRKPYRSTWEERTSWQNLR